MTILHQHSHTTLKYCSHVIYESGYKLGSLRWEIGASLIRYRINKSSKPLCKSINLHLQKFIGKSQKPLLNQNNLSPCLTFSLLHCSHVAYLNHQDISNQSNESPLFVMLAVFLSTFTGIYFVSTFFSKSTSLVATESHALHTTWNGLITTDRTSLYVIFTSILGY